MSLPLHLSSRNDDLLATLRPRLAAARQRTLAAGAGIPRPIPVLLPSSQLGDWLQVQLARELGLSMGFEFLQPSAFFQRHFAAGGVGADFARAHAFWAPERLRWQLLPEVDQIALHLGLDSATTLAPRDRFAFAQLLAQQFDRYARYRPDWPARWDANQPAWKFDREELSAAALTDEAWQRQLWRSLTGRPDTPPHPARLLNQLGAAAPVPPETVTPLFVVGTDRLDPLLVRTLAVLAHQGQAIELHLLLPSLGYLGDVSRRHRLKARLADASPEAADESDTHPLLASLGQQAVGTFLLLETLTQDYAEWPVADPADPDFAPDVTLLHRLQTDIRLQRPSPAPAGADESPGVLPRIQASDTSLRVHCCHSPRRELEVLRDELLRAFAELPGLLPEDVLVAVTDFDAYAPLAEAILRSDPHPLPVRLTAIPAREANPIAVALLALLRLSLGRHTASDLVDLLDLSAIQHRLDLAGEPGVLAQLAEAVRHSGLTHGLDATDRSTGDATGTWRAALDRHLAGAWLGPAPAAQDAAGAFVHPLASDLPHHDTALLKFLGWLTQLAGHLHTWRHTAPAAVWAERLEATVDDLLHSAVNDDPAAALRRLLGELAGVTATTPLDVGTVLDWLQPQLDNATSLRTSMGGEILFGRLDQLHGLPCRVLAILGLQDGAFPRAARRPAWDLLAHRPERFDGDPRAQDRQWFLDGMLAPRDRLILGAANRSLRTPHDGPLSACVEELVRVAAATVRPADGWDTLAQQLVVPHRIQPFSPDYFTAGSTLPRSFDGAAARIGAGITQASADHVRPFFTAAAEPPPSAAPETLTVTLAQLTAFWRDPAKAWLKALQLEVKEDEADDTALDDAPLTLDGLQAYTVRATALATHLAPATTPAATASSRLAADRALPPGALGVLAWELRDKEIAPLAAGLAPLLAQVARTSLELAVASDVRLIGELSLSLPAEPAPWILVYRPSNFEKSPKYQLEAFIHTLAATVHLARPVSCRVLVLDLPTPKELPAVPLDEARRYLASLVSGYRQGQRQPLAFAPATSRALADALADGEDATAALEKANASWSREPFRETPGGEGTSPTSALAWRDADPFAPPHPDAWVHWAREVTAPASHWWSGQTGAVAPAAAPAPPARPPA